MSRPLEDFKKQLCISRMEKTYYDNWKWFAENICEVLDTIPIIRETAYTVHDFSHHCFNIYRIISDILLYEDVYDSQEISSEALYLLNVAILFHDISMTKPNFNRLKHSAESESEFLSFCKMRKTKRLTNNQKKIIGTLIYSHSDLKQETPQGIVTEIITIKDNDKLMAHQQGDTVQTIPVKFLAGLLRLADELDITNSRLAGLEDQLEDLNTDDLDQAFSLECWYELQCFDQITINNGNAAIRVSDEMYMLDSKRTEDSVNRVIKKIKNAYDLIQEECFTGDYRRLVKLQKIEADYSKVSNSLGYDYGQSSVLQPLEISTKNNISNSESTTNDDEIKTSVMLVDEEVTTPLLIYKSVANITNVDDGLSDQIGMYIADHSMFMGGHYKLNEYYCARDWINTKKFIDDESMRETICMEIISHIKKRWSAKELNDILFVGVEEYGAIIASYIAHDINVSFSYIIPQKHNKVNSMQDTKFSCSKDQKIILFTDVIASGDTCYQVIIDNQINNVIGIYTLFYRPLKLYCKNDFKEDKLKSVDIPIYALNDAFTMSVFPKEDCPLKLVNNTKDICLDCQEIHV